MQSIRKSECPKEREPADRRSSVHVNLIRRDEECPVSPYSIFFYIPSVLPLLYWMGSRITFSLLFFEIVYYEFTFITSQGRLVCARWDIYFDVCIIHFSFMISRRLLNILFLCFYIPTLSIVAMYNQLCACANVEERINEKVITFSLVAGTRERVEP